MWIQLDPESGVELVYLFKQGIPVGNTKTKVNAVEVAELDVATVDTIDP